MIFVGMLNSSCEVGLLYKNRIKTAYEERLSTDRGLLVKEG